MGVLHWLWRWFPNGSFQEEPSKWVKEAWILTFKNANKPLLKAIRSFLVSRQHVCDYSCFGSLDASKRSIRLSQLLGFQTNRRRSRSRTDLFKHVPCFSKNLISTAPRCIVTFHWPTNRLFLQSSFDLGLQGRNLSTTSRKPVGTTRFRSRIVAKAPIFRVELCGSRQYTRHLITQWYI